MPTAEEAKQQNIDMALTAFLLWVLIPKAHEISWNGCDPPKLQRQANRRGQRFTLKGRRSIKSKGSMNCGAALLSRA